MVGTLGFVGLGAMGFPMARRLAAEGQSLAVYDVDAETRARAGRIEGVEAAGSLAEVAGRAEVLFTCLPNDAVVRESYLGDGGVAEAVGRGAITVDCSTVSAEVTRQVAEALEPGGVRHMDASMLGSVPQAESGEIGFVVGGDPEAFERIGPLLDILGRFRKYAGPSGSANRIKMIHQMLVATNAAAVAEAVALCLASNTDLDCFFDVVCNGGGFAYSRYFEKRVPRLRAAQDLARGSGLDTPVLDSVRKLFEAAQAEGWGDEDFSAVAHLYEAQIGRGFDTG
jgi:3-hydroxyisobutyrate dehydrogenase-like beta-hydroxyacid dehydrogenase